VKLLASSWHSNLIDAKQIQLNVSKKCTQNLSGIPSHGSLVVFLDEVGEGPNDEA
jgi:hypothetical protein